MVSCCCRRFSRALHDRLPRRANGFCKAARPTATCRCAPYPKDASLNEGSTPCPCVGGQSTTCETTARSVTEFSFSLRSGWQRLLFLQDGLLSSILHPPGVHCVEFKIRLILGRN